MKPIARKRITQKEVAKAANVSQALVSVVLNGTADDVAEATRAHILSVAKKIGYIPKRSLQPTNQKVLAYIRSVVVRGEHDEEWIYNATEDYYNRIQNLLLEAAHAAGYSLVVRPFSDADKLLQWLKEWNVNGVIWHGSGEVGQWIADLYPTIQLHRIGLHGADVVASHQEQAATIPLDYLRRLGHTRIATLFDGDITQPQPNPIYSLKSKAANDYLVSHHLPKIEELFAREHLDAIPTDQPLTVAALTRLIRSTLEAKHPDRPTALLTSDHAALFLIKKLSEAGFRFPEELSIIGIDNMAACSFITPELTSVDNSLDEVARVTIATLLERMEYPERPGKTIFITPKLIERHSVTNLSTHPVDAAGEEAFDSVAT